MLLTEILHVTPTAGLQSLRFHTVLSSTIDLKGASSHRGCEISSPGEVLSR